MLQNQLREKKFGGDASKTVTARPDEGVIHAIH